MLELGQEEQATVELQRALQIEPNHRLSQSLLRQITVDPVAALGRESFPYRVQPGETLSRISQRFLGDVYQFYLLARYNDLKVPRQLAGGQLLRIPGKAPPPDPAPATGSAPAVASPAAVPTPSVVPAAVSPATPPDPGRAERERRDRITRATRDARAAFARQDLATAIREWDRVLELEPDNATARLERQRAVDLQERLRRVR
jgi:LysM repeat protein